MRSRSPKSTVSTSAPAATSVFLTSMSSTFTADTSRLSRTQFREGSRLTATISCRLQGIVLTNPERLLWGSSVFPDSSLFGGLLAHRAQQPTDHQQYRQGHHQAETILTTQAPTRRSISSSSPKCGNVLLDSWPESARRVVSGDSSVVGCQLPWHDVLINLTVSLCEATEPHAWSIVLYPIDYP